MKIVSPGKFTLGFCVEKSLTEIKEHVINQISK